MSVASPVKRHLNADMLAANDIHYDITISHHSSQPARLPHSGTPPPSASSLLHPPRPPSPLRPATLTFAFQSSDFTDARYQLPAFVYEHSLYAQLVERSGSAASLAELDGELVGNRLLVERLDYRNVLSVYINSYRIHSTPLSKSRKDALSASPSALPPTDEPASTPVLLKPIPLPAYLLSVASSAFLLLTSSPKSSRTFLLLSNDAGAVVRYFGLVSDIIATPRSDQWLDVPDAARLQSQLRVWEEEREAELLREEEEQKNRLASKPANGSDASLLAHPQPVASYLSTNAPSARPARSALLTSSSRSSQLGGIRNLGNSWLVGHSRTRLAARSM